MEYRCDKNWGKLFLRENICLQIDTFRLWGYQKYSMCSLMLVQGPDIRRGMGCTNNITQMEGMKQTYEKRKIWYRLWYKYGTISIFCGRYSLSGSPKDIQWLSLRCDLTAIVISVPYIIVRVKESQVIETLQYMIYTLQIKFHITPDSTVIFRIATIFMVFSCKINASLYQSHHISTSHALYMNMWHL